MIRTHDCHSFQFPPHVSCPQSFVALSAKNSANTGHSWLALIIAYNG